MKKIIVIITTLGLLILFFFQNSFLENMKNYIASQYIFHTATKIEDVKTYIDGNKNNMKIIGETFGPDQSFMQIDGYVGGVRKKIAIVYTCSILCQLDAIAIDTQQDRQIIYGDLKFTTRIEDWGIEG